MWRLVGLVMLVACGSAPQGKPVVKEPVAQPRPFAPSALDKPAFAATPAELIAIARAQPANEWVILRDEYRAELDERGVITETQRTVFRLGETTGFARQHAYDSNTTGRPTVRVRLIHASGGGYELPATEMRDEPAYSEHPDLPARGVFYGLRDAVAGDVVEELVTRTIKPRVGRDNLARHVIGWSDVRVLQTRSVFSAPLSLEPAHLALVPEGAYSARTEADGRRVWTWELGPLEPVSVEEVALPQETAASFQIEFATGSRWPALAAAYLPTLERALAEPLTWPANLAKGRTQAAAIAIARWVTTNITTSHIDIDDGGLAVRTPAQTLAQGGANLDRAVLLVALLRAAGIPADLVLVDRAGGYTAFDAVPSLRALDHPLVRARAEGGEQWFCLDVDPLAHGRLLQEDRDRSALVIAAGTQGLIRTPASSTADHTSRIVRTFTLADVGPGLVEETIRETGELALIRQLGRQDQAQTAELMATYVRDQFAGTLTKETFAPQPDPTVALLELTIASANRVTTTIAGFEYQLPLADLLLDLPSTLVDDELPPRRKPFYWRLPYTAEVEHRFVLPAGFAAPPLPPDATRELGAGATFGATWRMDGRTVVSTLRFQTGTGTVSADAVNELRDALAELRDEPLTLRLVPEAFELTAARKHREALAALEALVRAHPKVLIHRQRLAYGLVALTLGTAARQVARDAVKLAPLDPAAHLTLGGILEFDRFGRHYGAGWDRAGAVAAFAKARKLDPKLASAAMEHGRVLLLGETGVQLEAGAQPALAAEAFGAAFALDQDPATGVVYALALIHARQFKDALAVLAKLPASANAGGLQIAALAMSASAAEVQEAIAGMDQTRDASIESAVRELVRLREWSAARTLVASQPQVAAARLFGGFANIGRVAPLPLKSKDPVVAAKRAFEAGLITTSDASYAWDATTAEEVTRSSRSDPSLAKLLGLLGAAAVRDILLTVMTPNFVGEPGGPWRVELAAGSTKVHYFVALDRGRAKIVGASFAVRGLGRHVLRLTKQGALDEAGQLVEWLAASPTSESLRVIATGLARTKENLELVGGLLAGEMVRTQPLFERCRDDASRSSAVRTECGKLVDSAKGTQVQQLARAGKVAEAETLVATIADPEIALVARMELEAARGNLAGAKTAAESLLAKAPSPVIQNQLAWILYVEGGDLVRALELANAAVGADPAKASRFILNTRAAILAETGRYDLAQEDLTQAHANLGRRDELGDTYIYARIAERLGYAAEAKRLYGEVAKGPNRDPLSADMLAKQRL